MLNNTIIKNDSALIPQKILPWLVCFSAALFFFYEFIQMNMFNAISGDLMKSYGVDGAGLGYLSASYFYGDVFFLLPAGILLDRLSVRKVIIIAMLLCIGGTFFFALTQSITLAVVCHFAAGVGNAFSFLSCVMLASRWFPPRRMALVIGLIVTLAMAGGLAAQTPLALLADAVGWRHALLYIAGLGVLVLGVILLFVRDYPAEKEHMLQQKQEGLQALGFGKSVKIALSNPQNWLCGLYTSFMNLPLMLLGALWGSLHLIQVQHLSSTQATDVTSMLFIGTIIGAPMIGWFSDRLKLRRMPMIIFAILSIATMIVIMALPQVSLITLIIMYLILGFVTSAQVISYPTIAESNSSLVTGTSMGIASVLIMGGAGIAQPLFGYLLDSGWNNLLVHGEPWYSQGDFTRALFILPITLILALFIARRVRETYCKPIQEETSQKEQHANI